MVKLYIVNENVYDNDELSTWNAYSKTVIAHKAFFDEAAACLYVLHSNAKVPGKYSYGGPIDLELPGIVAVMSIDNDECSLNNKAWLDIGRNRQIAADYKDKINVEVSCGMILGIVKVEE